MSEQAVEFYKAMLNSREVSFRVQERIFKLAKSRKNDVLMAALAKVPELAPGLDERIRKSAGARGLAGWASRPERSVEELRTLASTTKSISVAKALAELRDLPVEIYEQLLRFGNAAVSFALVLNPSVPTEIRAKAAPPLARTTSYRQTRDIEPLLVADEDFLTAFALSEEISYEALNALGHAPVLPSEVQEALLVRYENLPPLTSHYDRYYNSLSYLLGNAARSMEKDLIKRFIAAMVKKGVHSSERDYKNALDALSAPKAPNFSKKIREASSAKELEGVVNSLSGNLTTSLATAVAMHPAVSLDLLATVLPKCQWWSTSSLLSRYKDRPEFMATVLFFNGAYITDSLLFASKCPEEILSKIFDLATDHLRLPPREALQSRFMNADLAKRLPARHVRGWELPSSTLEAIESLLERTFGDHLDAWETFETLLDGHEGSIGDLIDQVAALVELDLEPAVKAEPVKPARAAKAKVSLDNCDPLF